MSNCEIDYWFILLMGPSASGKTYSVKNNILGQQFDKINSSSQLQIPETGFSFDGAIFRKCSPTYQQEIKTNKDNDIKSDIYKSLKFKKYKKKLKKNFASYIFQNNLIKQNYLCPNYKENLALIYVDTLVSTCIKNKNCYLFKKCNCVKKNKFDNFIFGLEAKNKVYVLILCPRAICKIQGKKREKDEFKAYEQTQNILGKTINTYDWSIHIAFSTFMKAENIPCIIILNCGKYYDQNFELKLEEVNNDFTSDDEYKPKELTDNARFKLTKFTKHCNKIIDINDCKKIKKEWFSVDKEVSKSFLKEKHSTPKKLINKTSSYKSKDLFSEIKNPDKFKHIKKCILCKSLLSNNNLNNIEEKCNYWHEKEHILSPAENLSKNYKLTKKINTKTHKRTKTKINY